LIWVSAPARDPRLPQCSSDDASVRTTGLRADRTPGESRAAVDIR